MSVLFLVETADGALVRKAAEDLNLEDRMVLDGPESTATLDAAAAELEAEIQAAGGLDAWRGAHGDREKPLR